MGRLLLILGIILIVLWLLGFIAFHISTPFLHLLIVIGVILIIVDILSSRRNWW